MSNPEFHLKTYWFYTRLPKWRQRLHRLAHLVGLNRCELMERAAGYRCITCGETHRWKEN